MWNTFSGSGRSTIIPAEPAAPPVELQGQYRADNNTANQKHLPAANAWQAVKKGMGWWCIRQ